MRTSDGEVIDCRLRGNFRIKGIKSTNPIAVGDFVEFELQTTEGTGLITAVEERRNCIIRRSTKLSKQTHIIAANLDQACLVATIGFPRTSTGFIDRFLVTAEAYHVPCTLDFNKTDLYDDVFYLDHNGRLEVLTASLQGTGLYTWVRCWEANAAFSAQSVADARMTAKRPIPGS